jgi:hypothetical protein
VRTGHYDDKVVYVDKEGLTERGLRVVVRHELCHAADDYLDHPIAEDGLDALYQWFRDQSSSGVSDGPPLQEGFAEACGLDWVGLTAAQMECPGEDGPPLPGSAWSVYDAVYRPAADVPVATALPTIGERPSEFIGYDSGVIEVLYDGASSTFIDTTSREFIEEPDELGAVIAVSEAQGPWVNGVSFSGHSAPGHPTIAIASFAHLSQPRLVAQGGDAVWTTLACGTIQNLLVGATPGYLVVGMWDGDEGLRVLMVSD